MKFWVLCVTFLLTGCGSLVTDRMFNDNLLDVARKAISMCVIQSGVTHRKRTPV